MYPSFAAVAREEGFDSIADTFEAIAVAEKQHEKRYNALLSNINGGTVFKKEEPCVWRCLNCGYVHEGTEALKVCPVCSHPQAFQELLGENW
jgi:rubrerythrin